MSVKNFVLDLLFPKKCVCCGKLDFYACAGCFKKIIFIKQSTCPECGKLSEKGRYCLKCRKGKSLKGVILATYFEEGPIRELVHVYKYNGVFDIKSLLGGFLLEALKREGFTEDFVLAYVPLHRKKLIKRGYNQSELLAQEIAKTLEIEFVRELLIKKKETKSQIGLKRKERLESQKGSFEINTRRKQLIVGRKVVLVDDIFTTGATLNECAKVLKENGVKEVWGLAIGRHL